MAKRKAETPERPAEYTVVARRYRPQQFADLVGQEPVAQALVNAIKTGRIAHAYLLTGTRGVGKTTTARILAKALNCVKGPTPTPCDECESCKAIAAGQDIDVLEIDGASNRRIDEVREIRQNVQFRPSRSRYKIYIVDEVHMLVREAFNALLKTLEEPPPHVKFIFATTDAEKLPITIRSRCQRFDFAGIPTARIVDQLRDIVHSEGRLADEDALNVLARRAAGSMRDAQSLLDQLLAFGEERLTVSQVHQLLGTATDESVAEIADAAFAGDAKSAIEKMSAGVAHGLQLGELLDQLIDHWRDLMIVACAGESAQGLNSSPDMHAILHRQATIVSLDTILAGLDVLQATRMQLRNTSRGRVLVEMALVRLSRLNGLMSLSQIAQFLQGGVELPAPAAPKAIAPPELKKKPIEVTAAPLPPGPTTLTAETLPQVWPEILAQIGQILAERVKVAGLPAISGPNTLVLHFSPEYNAHRQYVTDEARLKKIAEAVKRLSGRDWTIRVEIAHGRNGIAAAPVVPAAPKPAAVDHALLQKAQDVLGAKLLHVDDGFGATPEPDDEG